MKLRNFQKQQLGQGLSEYIIIVALIAVAAIGAVSFFGGTVSNQVSGMAQEMSGQSAQQSIQDAEGTAEGAANAAGAKGLGNYDDGNVESRDAFGGGN